MKIKTQKTQKISKNIEKCKIEFTKSDVLLHYNRIQINPFEPSLIILPSVSPSFSRDSSGI